MPPALPLARLGEVPTASTTAYLLWLARLQWRTLTLGVVTGIVWTVALALIPYALGRAVDEGVAGSADGSVPAALWQWTAVLAGLVLLNAAVGVVRHRMAVWNWVGAALTSSQVVGHHASRTGTALPQRLATGEVVATVASDAVRLGDAYEVTTRLAGSVAAYVVVSVLLLRASTTLGLLVLVGVPLLVGCLAVVVRPLHRTQAAQREVSGRLTALGADTVAGLRVLRGVGGEQVFLRRYTARSQEVREAGVRVAGVQGTLDGLQVLLPGAFVVVVVWIGARFALSGRISVGELVAFYGYATFLVQPLRTATEALQKVVRARVGAQRILAVLAVRPAVSDPAEPAAAPPTGAVLADPTSGVVVRPGVLTALVCEDPSASAAVAERLARLDDAADRPATLGGVPLDRLPVADVRRRVVLVDSDPRLFTGWLRSELDPWGRRTDAEVVAALEVAAAGDVLEAVDAGLDSEVTERGRSLSGGQRQRVSLARGLLTDAEVLVLVEPTSAVDAHTEAAVAERLERARRGRTTVLVTTSPLLLDRADQVVLLRGVGDATRAVAVDTHHHLLRRDDAVGRHYRRVVTRSDEDEEVPA